MNKGAIGRLIELLVPVDGEFVYDLRSDGLIVATPTGSTAYALSANGPILHPTVPAIALVPISPHTLSNRPIAISDTCVVEITLKRGADARANRRTAADRARRGRLSSPCGARRTRVTLVHPEGYRYYSMLREKLHWTESPLLGSAPMLRAPSRSAISPSSTGSTSSSSPASPRSPARPARASRS